MDLDAGTRAARIYGTSAATEPYYCSYGVNPAWEPRLARAGVVVSGRGPGGETRIIELPSHPFFVATLFVPRARRADGRPHPIYAALAAAGAATPRSA